MLLLLLVLVLLQALLELLDLLLLLLLPLLPLGVRCLHKLLLADGAHKLVRHLVVVADAARSGAWHMCGWGTVRALATAYASEKHESGCSYTAGAWGQHAQKH